MRLIDADELLTVTEIREDGTEFSFVHCSEIEDAKVVYDVDAVVKQLEELNKYNLNLADCMLDIQSHGLNRHFICLEDAIEIVKGGGVDGKKQSQ